MQNKGYDTSFLEILKTKCDIVSTISKYLPLNKKGKTYWGCCPFHHEKTPSFAVNESEQYYHCFGCGESGDVIKFLQKLEVLDFMEAVKKLAADAGLEVPVFAGDEKLVEQKKIREKAYSACNLAMAHYRDNLKLNEAASAREYLKKRGITENLITKFNIGFSNGWTSLIDYLQSKGISNDVMRQAGLVDEKTNERGMQIYDSMATRLIFPIINRYGDCIGFTGRNLTEGNFAKYKNTAQTVIFDKSKSIYNIYNIKELKQKQKIDSIIICEGTMDVIALVREGFENAVACLGTSITVQHAKELSGFTDKIILCLDGDSAGNKATMRAINILAEGYAEENSSINLDIRIVVLPENLDPDDYLKKYGAAKLKNLLDLAEPIIDYKIKAIAKKYNLTDNFDKTKFLIEIKKEIFDDITSDSIRDVYLRVVSSLVNISIDILRRDFSKDVQINLPQQNKEDLINREEGNNKAIKFVLASILHKKEYAIVNENIKLHFFNSDHQKLYDYIMQCLRENKVFTISHIFDLFDVDDNPSIKELVNYSFAKYEGKEELYFRQSLTKIYNLGLQFEFDELAAAYKNESDLNKRREIAQRLSELAKLKNNKGDNLYV